MARSHSLTLVLALLASAAAAQQAPLAQPAPARLPIGVGDTSAFRTLGLPAGSLLRTASGEPGREYWQQRVDYVIRASLDTVANEIAGEERITYANNSPDTLRYLWLQLDQNLFSPESRGSRIFDQAGRFGAGEANGGFRLTRVALAADQARRGKPAAAPVDLAHVVNGTMMRIDLPRALAPQGRVTLDVAWSFPFTPSNNRMGLETIDDGTVYEVAQWYPRMAVYDDVHGWNTAQYYGQGEFYLEYGRFDVSLTVPADMLVAATGTLQNPAAVLTPVQRARLARARMSDSTVVIRGSGEVRDPATRPPSRTGTHTWRFTADSVRDFAFAAARHFVWDAARANGGRTLAMSFYPPSADSIWSQSTQFVKFAVENYSSWYAYPYPVAINVNGIEGGMEYPMIVFCHNRTDGPGLFSVTDHEIGHTWFPMLVGSNERLYPWMDEGFNTFMNHYNWAKQYPASYNRRGDPGLYIPLALSSSEQPAITPADRIKGNLGVVAYTKPALGLILLRDHVVGAERFDPAFKEYIRRWAYKHPTPADFFRTIEDGVGEDLSWFWRSWFYRTDVLDQAVDSVTVSGDDGAVISRVHLRSAGAMVMPVTLRIRLEDGAVRDVDLPVEIWFGGNRYTATVPGDTRVVSATIDPDMDFPDVRRENNRWTAPGTPSDTTPNATP